MFKIASHSKYHWMMPLINVFALIITIIMKYYFISSLIFMYTYTYPPSHSFSDSFEIH